MVARYRFPASGLTGARDAPTKGGADVKKGGKVTVEYKMTATGIEMKGGKAKGDEKGKK